MKKFVSLILSLAFAGSTFAQMSGYSSSQSDGTTLGANETLTADGIALGNAVKLRGYVDFIYSYYDINGVGDDARFTSSGDVDFLFDLSPITGELHLNAHKAGVNLEQIFARYSFNQDFGLSFGRQVTVLGYEGDEKTDLATVSRAYFIDSQLSHPALVDNISAIADEIGGGLTESSFPKLRKNYVDGIRANYNNGMLGFSLGIHDGYWSLPGDDHFNDNVAVDLAASVMFFPGLEARLGYAHQDANNTDVGHFNGWIAYNPSALTLALEFDVFDFDDNDEMWDLMLLASYQFNDLFTTTLRYTHEDWELGVVDLESDRISLALLFAITNHFDIKVEYSHTNTDVSIPGGSGDLDSDEFYVESIVSF